MLFAACLQHPKENQNEQMKQNLTQGWKSTLQHYSRAAVIQVWKTETQKTTSNGEDLVFSTTGSESQLFDPRHKDWCTSSDTQEKEGQINFVPCSRTTPQPLSAYKGRAGKSFYI